MWWDELKPELDVDALTVTQVRGLVERGALAKVSELIGLPVDDVPEPALVDALVEMVVLMAETQGLGRGRDDVMAMPYQALLRVVGVAGNDDGALIES